MNNINQKESAMAKITDYLTNMFSRIKNVLLPLLNDPKKRWWLIGPAFVIVLTVIGLSYYGLVILPTQQAAAAQPVMQTATVRRGNITLSASGTGTLVAANQVQLGFGSSGTLTTLNVKVGDKVKKGQLLGAINNTSQQIQFVQAQRAMANLTSGVSVATAQQDLATAQTSVSTARNQLIYLVGPQLYNDQQKLAAAQLTLDQAKAAADATPTSAQQKAIEDAAAAVKNLEHQIEGDKIWYTTIYVPNIFTVAATRSHPKSLNAPTVADIAAAQAAYAAAQASVQEAQWYLDALNGKDVPADATGANLSTFEQAKLTLQSAKETLDGTQLFAPFDGVVTTVTNQLGDSVGSSPMITIADMSKLYIQTYIDETDYAKFAIGNTANIVLDALPNLNLTGKVVEVNPALVTSSGTSAVSGMVQLDPTSEHLLLGMSAAVEVIAGDAQNAVLVPVAALHETTPGQFSVFLVTNGKLSLKTVTIGLQDVVNAEVKSGLQPGDVVSTGIVGTK
jgi:HlyD family secretion protein